MFSELVDICVSRSKRTDKRADVISFVNQTIREMQAKQRLAKNLNEDKVVTTAEPHIWTPPTRFQRMRTVLYEATLCHPKFLQPGVIQRKKNEYYYRSTTAFVFVGAGLNTVIDLAYYRFVKKLQYYELGKREAVYDFTTETWSFPLQEAFIAQMKVNGYTAAEIAAQQAIFDAQQQGHIDNASNWILLDWFELVQEGTLAKLWKLLEDEKRAATHFSFYMRQYNEAFLSTELEPVEHTE